MTETDFTRAALTDDEWRTLRLAPLWIFSAIIGSYRNFDELELAAFLHSVELATAAPGRLAGEVTSSLVLERDAVLAEYGADNRTIAVGLCSVAAILGKAPAEEAELFKDMLVSAVGAQFARARGRFGRVISDDDEKTLGLLAAILG